MKTKEFLEGHFNAFTPDQESRVTGYGKHARVMATIPRGGEMYCRVDLKWGLREPTVQEVLKVARIDGDIKGKWVLRSWEQYEATGHESIEIYFDRA